MCGGEAKDITINRRVVEILFDQGLRETVQWYKSQLKPTGTELVA
jgi:hypothetical protein